MNQSDDQRRQSVLFNDITHAAVEGFIPLSDRLRIMEHLWAKGWRRDVRPEDITEHRIPPPPVMPDPLPDPVIRGRQ